MHRHSRRQEPADPQQAARERAALGKLMALLVPLFVATVVGLIVMWPSHTSAHIQSDTAAWKAPGVTIVKGTITSVAAGSCDGTSGSTGAGGSAGTGGSTAPGSRAGSTGGGGCARVSVHIDQGPDAGSTTGVQLTDAVTTSGVRAGQAIRMYRSPGDHATYQFYDFERTLPLIVIAMAFAAAVIAVARWRGAAAILSLVIAFLIIGRFMLPALISGSPATWVGLVACSAIMFVVIYLTHGFSTRTSTALLGTLFGLLLTACLGYGAAKWAHLTGVTSEDDFVLTASAPDLTLSSVIICGLIVAGLGVLNDVTVTQASAVWELADGAHSRRDLYRRAMRIGRDHIASSVYTIAFATAGAALSTLLLLAIYQMPVADALRSETFSGEIVRTLVGSIGLVLAVPLTTLIGTVLAWGTTHGRAAAVDAPRAEEERRESAPDAPAPTAPRRPRRSLDEDAAFRRPEPPEDIHNP